MSALNGLSTSPAEPTIIGRSSPAPSGSEGEEELDSNDDAPENSKKRKRSLKISCELCKARKVRCDRAEPACGWVSSVYLCHRQVPGF
jgi:hypothetical protein